MHGTFQGALRKDFESFHPKGVINVAGDKFI
jgi:hypothetical protein